MLTSKERAKLKSAAATIEASVIVGINGVTENLIAQVKMDLNTKELCKVKVLPNCGNIVKECMDTVCQAVKAEPVCTVGNNFIIYKCCNKKGFEHILTKSN